MIYTTTNELDTQKRVIKLLEQLGYEYLGNWRNRKNSNIEVEYLRKYLLKQNQYNTVVIDKAIDKLCKNSKIAYEETLYSANQRIYNNLRYGLSIKEDIHQKTQTIFFIDWHNLNNNHFAVAEEVTVKSENYDKRPDLVLYINGIAIGVIELKSSVTSVGDGIRQNIGNQEDIFIKPFFSTIQLVMAGQDYQGLRYGSIQTSEKYFLTWKEVGDEKNSNDEYLLSLNEYIRNKCSKVDYALDKHIIQMLDKKRILEIIYNFIAFDRGKKKICRPHQYFGIKASQNYIQQDKGGIIWHTQGSGKSLTMVWLTKYILENNPNPYGNNSQQEFEMNDRPANTRGDTNTRDSDEILPAPRTYLPTGNSRINDEYYNRDNEKRV